MGMELGKSDKKDVTPEEYDELVSEITSTKKFKIGLILFFIYIAIYTIFTIMGAMGMGSSSTGTFGKQMWGMNVGLVFGMFIIGLAIVMAVCFNFYAAKFDPPSEEDE